MPPLHLVSAFATTARLVLAQEAVPDKASELAAISVLLQRLGAEYRLAVKANQPTLRAEVEAAFAEAADRFASHVDPDKGHGRIEQRPMSVLRETDWLAGHRRFPGEFRLPGAVCPLRAETTVQSRGATPTETRHFIASRPLNAPDAATATREHWAIENRLHRVLDVTFGDDLSRLRKDHGARNMSTVRHFAISLVRADSENGPIKSRRERTGWSPQFLQRILSSPHA